MKKKFASVSAAADCRQQIRCEPSSEVLIGGASKLPRKFISDFDQFTFVPERVAAKTVHDARNQATWAAPSPANRGSMPQQQHELGANAFGEVIHTHLSNSMFGTKSLAKS